MWPATDGIGNRGDLVTQKLLADAGLGDVGEAQSAGEHEEYRPQVPRTQAKNEARKGVGRQQ